MKILVTGATGVLGTAAIPALIAAGGEVKAVARSTSAEHWLRAQGARSVRADLFDPADLSRELAGMDAVVHHATAIPPVGRMADRSSWATNDRLRTEATAMLVDGAIEAGVSRFVQQSITLFYADGGERWLDEEAPIEPAWDVVSSALDAEAEVRRFVGGGGTGVVLRLARLYGPGRASAEYVDAIEQGALPIADDGDPYVSSLHVDDATTALVAALEAPTGVYNVGDDEPVTERRYKRSLAEALGAPEPPHVPVDAVAAHYGDLTKLITLSHRVSNRRFRETTGWAPRYPSVLDGWATVAEHAVREAS